MADQPAPDTPPAAVSRFPCGIRPQLALGTAILCMLAATIAAAYSLDYARFLGFVSIAAVAALAATLLTARLFLAPIARIAAATARLAAGDYTATAEIRDAPGAIGRMVRALAALRERLIAAEAISERFQDLLATAGDAIICIDGRQRIVTFNREAERIFGYAADEIMGRPLDILLPENARSGHRGEVASFAGSSDPRRLMGGRAEIRGRRKDGSEFFAEAAISKTQTSDGMFFTAVLRDVSLRRQMEEKLRAAKREAEASNAAKSEFLANVSHELRTPLNAIIGFSEMVKNEALGPVSPPEYREFARDIHLSAGHLLRVINDILDVSKARAGRIELNDELVRFKDLASECLHIAQGMALQRSAALRLESDHASPVLFADRTRLKQMLLNLLSNAVKFTPSGGAIMLSVAIDRRGRAILAVEDNGIGMAPEQVPIALEPFQQIDARLSRRYEGAGLGLSITKRLAELHGGELQITSAPGQGTIARIVLPADRVIAAAERAHQ